MSEQVIAGLEFARSLIENGWVQGTGSTADGRVCLLIALDLSAPSTQAFGAMRELVRRNLPVKDVHGTGWRGIVEFNDTPGREVTEVLAVLDRTIMSLKNEEGL